MTKHEANNSFDEIAAMLEENGFKTLQFDLPIFHADGTCHELALSERAKIVQKIAEKYNPAGLVAQSYGVTTVLLTILPSVQSQVFISGAFFPNKNLNSRYHGAFTLQRTDLPPTHVTKEFWDDVNDFNDISIAKHIRKSTCILHGDRDDKIPVGDAETFYDAMDVKTKKIKIYKGGDHGLSDVPLVLRNEFLSDILHWFQETL